MKTTLGIIPARYASTRFPGKPLAIISGKPMIRHVYERVNSILNDVLVATDDERIVKVVEQFSGRAVMTSPNHKSGTDRCKEAAELYCASNNKTFDVIMNIQGDEPFIHPEQISLLQQCFEDKEIQIATLIKIIENENILFDPNRPKVVTDKQGFALYFSRSPIPYLRNQDSKQWHLHHVYYQHIGIYAFRHHVLNEICQLPEGKLEKAESLEQLRWLESDYRIKTMITPFESHCIDTPEDLQNLNL